MTHFRLRTADLAIVLCLLLAGCAMPAVSQADVDAEVRAMLAELKAAAPLAEEDAGVMLQPAPEWLHGEWRGEWDTGDERIAVVLRLGPASTLSLPERGLTLPAYAGFSEGALYVESVGGGARNILYAEPSADRTVLSGGMGPGLVMFPLELRRSRFGGMTTLGRLVEAGLLDEFDAAIVARDREKLLSILNQVEMGGELGERTADNILSKPASYWLEVPDVGPGYVEPKIVPGKEYLEVFRLPKEFRRPVD